MQNPFKEKLFEQQETQKKVELPKFKKMRAFDDLENMEIKKLEPSDSDDVFMLMKKALWEVSKTQVLDIVKIGFSYGAYVERMLVGVGLASVIYYDEKTGEFGQPATDSAEFAAGKNANALFLEEVAFLLAYEGSGIRKLLVEERENAAIANGLSYAIATISSEWSEGNLEDMIKETGNKMEKLYLTQGYSFRKTGDKVIAVKKLI